MTLLQTSLRLATWPAAVTVSPNLATQ